MALGDIFDTQGIDPQEYRKKLAMGLMQSGSDVSPIRSWTQGAARMAQALVGGMMMNQSQQQQQEAYKGLIPWIQQGGGQAAPSPTQATPTAATPTVTPTATPTDTSQPRGLRNNNPGNIEDGPFAKSLAGYAGSDGRFAKFASLDHGIGAMDNLLQNYGKQGIKTVSDVINRWAPPSDNNPTTAYAETVANGMGVRSTDPINLDDPTTRGKLALGIARFENGKPLPQEASLSPQPTSTGVLQPQPAPQQPTLPQPQQTAAPNVRSLNPDIHAGVVSLLQSNNPYAQKFGANLANVLIGQQLEEPKLVMMKNMLQEDVPYWARGATQTLTPAAPGGTGVMSGAVGGGQPAMTNEDLLKAADAQYPGVANRVEQLYRGEGGMPNARQNKLDGPAMSLIQRVHPDFNMNMWSEKNKMWSQLGSALPNQWGGRLQALVNSMDHLANTSDAAVKKGNISGWVSPITYPANLIQSMSDTQRGILNDIKQESETYGGERVKFLTGAQGTDEDRKSLYNSLSPETSSPQQMGGALRGSYVQLKDAMHNTNSQIAGTIGTENFWGPANKRGPLIDDKMKQTMARIEKNIAILESGGKLQTTPSPKQPQPTPQGQQPPQQGGVIKWGRDKDGNPVPLQ